MLFRSTLNQKFNSATAVKLGLSRRQGAQVTSVKAGGPAQSAKLQAGDVVLTFDGVRVENDSHLIYLVSLTNIGEEVPLTVFRNGQMLKIAVKVGNKSDFER